MDLTIRREDNERTRILKTLLTYGTHKEGCDRSNESGPPGVQHLCCSCGWCQEADWAEMLLLGMSADCETTGSSP